jgi:hypothetical protein
MVIERAHVRDTLLKVLDYTVDRRRVSRAIMAVPELTVS